jgi:RNA-directed DNA polymerase
MIPKPGGSGKLRKLGIPALADKVVQASKISSPWDLNHA